MHHFTACWKITTTTETQHLPQYSHFGFRFVLFFTPSARVSFVACRRYESRKDFDWDTNSDCLNRSEQLKSIKLEASSFNLPGAKTSRAGNNRNVWLDARHTCVFIYKLNGILFVCFLYSLFVRFLFLPLRLHWDSGQDSRQNCWFFLDAGKLIACLFHIALSIQAPLWFAACMRLWINSWIKCQTSNKQA